MGDATQPLEWSSTLLEGKRIRSVAEVNAAVAALGPEWYLPTVKELFSIVDHSRTNPAIDTEKFPDIKPFPYWTSTPTAWDESARWFVDFDNGVVNSDNSYGGCVVACRASQ